MVQVIDLAIVNSQESLKVYLPGPLLALFTGGRSLTVAGRAPIVAARPKPLLHRTASVSIHAVP
jgi:hypothetical protein